MEEKLPSAKTTIFDRTGFGSHILNGVEDELRYPTRAQYDVSSKSENTNDKNIFPLSTASK
jgi:hypothetical protein